MLRVSSCSFQDPRGALSDPAERNVAYLTILFDQKAGTKTGSFHEKEIDHCEFLTIAHNVGVSGTHDVSGP